MSEPPTPVDEQSPRAGEADDSRTAADVAEDERTQRRRLAAVWAAAGSAVACMVALGWSDVVRHGGRPPGGDMDGHAAAAEWLRTLPWWDWRGWSDWFYGGQAIGVNYPPLGHALMRFTHPGYGQMAAVSVALLVLLPWGASRVARAVGYPPRVQRTAVGAVLVLTAASAGMHWVLSGFHYVTTFFGSWPATMATVLGLFCAAWAARCTRPVACGVVAAVAILFNGRVVPGVAVVCLALLVSSGASFRQAVRWTATVGTTALAACAWWLVPFLAGWERLVRWEVPLSRSWRYGGPWQVVVLAVLGLTASLAARRRVGPSRRLALAAAAGMLATLVADLLGYLRPERWMELPILAAAVAAAGMVADRDPAPSRPVRPAWAVVGVAFVVVLVVVAGRLEALPLAVWLLWWPRRTWAAAGALAWVAILIFVPVWRFGDPPESEPPPEAAAELRDIDGEGLVYLNLVYNTAAGDVDECAWPNHLWLTASATGGRIRPLLGLYAETSAAAEFIHADHWLRNGYFEARRGRRPHWFDAWQEVGAVSLAGPAAPEALGARWYASCDSDGDLAVTGLAGTIASGVEVAMHADEDGWHRAAVEWWIPIAAIEPSASIGSEDEVRSDARSGTADSKRSAAGSLPAFPPVPILSSGERPAFAPDIAATGVAMHADGDHLVVTAESAGWAWLRVPWDPDWRSLGGTPVRKGGPGHLIVWAERGETHLRWSVPAAVNVAAAATSGSAVLALVLLTVVNRRKGWTIDPERHKPAAEAVNVFADTVDGWANATTVSTRRLLRRWFRRG